MTATVVEPSEGGLRRILRDAGPLLLAVAFLMAGNGLTSTLLGIRARLEGFAPTVVGLVLAGYYAGFLAGSLAAPSTIARVGHVRVFAGLASLASGAVLIHVLRPEPVTWFTLRAVSGMCISALYVVCETWLNGVSTNRTRGSLLAIYMVVVSGSLLAGQLLFSIADPGGFAPFVLASVLVSLAVVPVSLASFAAPVMPDPVPISTRALVAVAPLAAVGAALAGFIGAAMIGAGVVYAAEAGFTQVQTGGLIGAALAGGVALQVPLGRWSDLVDRRAVIAAASYVAAAVALATALTGSDHPRAVIALATVAGGTSFPLYALSSAHMNDYLAHELVVAGGARMVLVNGAGSIGGPIAGAAAIGAFGADSLFTVLASGYLLVGTYAIYRMTRRAAPAEEDRASFSPSAVGLGSTATMLPEAEVDDVYPVVEGAAETDGAAVPFREQGSGEPVVLVETGDTWEGVLRALAADGMRAIAVGADSEDALLAVLRHLELPSAVFAGSDEGGDLVSAFAEEHPDRADALVLLCDRSEHDRIVMEQEAHKPTLVLDRSRLSGDPEELADHIAEFMRRR